MGRAIKFLLIITTILNSYAAKAKAMTHQERIFYIMSHRLDKDLIAKRIDNLEDKIHYSEVLLDRKKSSHGELEEIAKIENSILELKKEIICLSLN